MIPNQSMEQYTASPHIDLHAESRVLLFIASRPLSQPEAQKAVQTAEVFTQNWTAHHQALSAGATIIFQQILVLAVDETKTGASGCSLDKATHFVEQLGAELNVDFFVRDIVFYSDAEGKVMTTKLHQLPEMINNGSITLETPVFNTMAKTLGQATQQGWAALGQSWQKRFV